MSHHNPYEQYRQTQISTASQGALILMLYDAAIRNLHRAQSAMEDKKISEAHAALLKTQDIITELNIALNMETGDIAQRLRALYEYMLGRLIEANTHKDTTIVAEMLVLLGELKEAWDGVIRKGKTLSNAGGFESGV